MSDNSNQSNTLIEAEALTLLYLQNYLQSRDLRYFSAEDSTEEYISAYKTLTSSDSKLKFKNTTLVKVKFSSYTAEALTMLYLQSREVPNNSKPEKLADKYISAYKSIKATLDSGGAKLKFDNPISVNFSPSTVEALTLLYLQLKEDLNKLDLKDLAGAYKPAYKSITETLASADQD